VRTEEITILILTYNEAPNLMRCLDRLRWANQVLLLDSGSTDETVMLAGRHPGMRVMSRTFATHAQQWNFGLDQMMTPWVLALDADYILPENFLNELQSLQPNDDVVALFAQFRYCIFGRPLRCTLYPPRAVLFRKDRCRYIQDGHTQQLEINGRVSTLNSVIDHDDRKSLSHWLWSQDRYARLEAAKLLETPAAQMRLQDRLRQKIVLAPALVFFYTLFGKGLILDGWPGWYYVFQRTLAEIILSLRLLETKLNPSTSVR
jgi:glycosyltransferase involved in cell wall biosynthesis